MSRFLARRRRVLWTQATLRSRNPPVSARDRSIITAPSRGGSRSRDNARSLGRARPTGRSAPSIIGSRSPLPKVKRHVVAVTGSPNDSRLHPTTQLSPAGRAQMKRQTLSKIRPSRGYVDPETIWERGMDLAYSPDLEDWNRGMPLADMECPHGKLPNDQKIYCECWGLPIARFHEDLRQAREKLVNRPARALYTLVYGL